MCEKQERRSRSGKKRRRFVISHFGVMSYIFGSCFSLGSMLFLIKENIL